MKPLLITLSLLTFLAVPFTNVLAQREAFDNYAAQEAQKIAREKRKAELNEWIDGLVSDLRKIFDNADTCPIIERPNILSYWSPSAQRDGQELLIYEAHAMANALSLRFGPCPWDVSVHVTFDPCYVGFWEDGELVAEEVRGTDIYFTVCVPWKISGYYGAEDWITDAIVVGVR